MVIKNTRIFIEKFEKAAEKLKLSYAHGKVHYDLDEKLSDIEYYDLAMKDGFESVFHKVKEGYEIQNEVRFAVINPDKPEHMELMLLVLCLFLNYNVICASSGPSTVKLTMFSSSVKLVDSSTRYRFIYKQ